MCNIKSISLEIPEECYICKDHKTCKLLKQALYEKKILFKYFVSKLIKADHKVLYAMNARKISRFIKKLSRLTIIALLSISFIYDTSGDNNKRTRPGRKTSQSSK